MIILNTTFHVDDDIHINFLSYMKNTYINKALKDQLVLNARLCKIHSHKVEEGHSYSVQFNFQSLEDLEEWDKTNGRHHNTLLLDHFKNKVAGFSTLLEEIEL